MVKAKANSNANAKALYSWHLLTRVSVEYASLLCAIYTLIHLDSSKATLFKTLPLYRFILNFQFTAHIFHILAPKILETFYQWFIHHHTGTIHFIVICAHPLNPNGRSTQPFETAKTNDQKIVVCLQIPFTIVSNTWKRFIWVVFLFEMPVPHNWLILLQVMYAWHRFDAAWIHFEYQSLYRNINNCSRSIMIVINSFFFLFISIFSFYFVFFFFVFLFFFPFLFLLSISFFVRDKKNSNKIETGGKSTEFSL